MNKQWTAQEEQQIRDMQKEKIPANAMAQVFGVTYSAMLSKIHRMKTEKKEDKKVNDGYFSGGREVKRGEIYYIEAGSEHTVGSEQRSGRPAIIVQNDKGNENSSTVEVVYLTTQDKKPLPTHVEINSSKYKSIALCEQIKTIRKDRLGDYVGQITKQEQQELDKALAVSIGIDITSNTHDIGVKETEKEIALEKENEELRKDVEFCENRIKDLEAKIEVLESSDNQTDQEIRVEAERDTYKAMYEQLLTKLIEK